MPESAETDFQGKDSKYPNPGFVDKTTEIQDKMYLHILTVYGII